MAEWSFLVPPDITVTVRARRRPSFLARCLGDEVVAVGAPTLLLDLTPPDPWPGPALIRGVYKKVPWACWVSANENGGWELSWQSPIRGEYLALHVALLPALRRILVERGVALVLGAAFEFDGAATVIAGATGTGKTTTLVGALSRGGNLIGDEYVGLGSANEVTPVIRALALRRTSLELAPGLFRQLGLPRRLQLRMGQLANRLTQGHLDPLVHVSPPELGFRSSSNRGSSFNSMFWLESSGAKALECERMEPGETINRLAAMQAAHDRAYGSLGGLLNVTAIDNECEASDNWKDVLAQGLAGVSCFRLLLPADPTWPEALEQVLQANSSRTTAVERLAS